jgi:hypothetical protein
MASVAREVTAYDEQRRELQQWIDLAREIHEGVVQRLFGISLALSRDELTRSSTSVPARCSRSSSRATCRTRACSTWRRVVSPGLQATPQRERIAAAPARTAGIIGLGAAPPERRRRARARDRVDRERPRAQRARHSAC